MKCDKWKINPFESSLLAVLHIPHIICIDLGTFYFDYQQIAESKFRADVIATAVGPLKLF